MDFRCGILYIATGKKYIEEAVRSALSCKQTNPYPIALITDSNDYEIPEHLFDVVIIKGAEYSFRDKLLVKYTPFDKTIFLDTDTLVINGLQDLFRLLDFREFTIYQQDEGYEFDMPELSGAMPEFNTGMIAYRMTENVKQLFEDWDASFDRITEIKTDQYHLRKTLYESDVRFATVSSAYNFIVYYTNFVIQHVKVLHGRPASYLEEIAKKINSVQHESGWRRTFYPSHGSFYILYANLNTKDSYKILKANFRIYLASIKQSIIRRSRKTVRNKA